VCKVFIRDLCAEW